MILDLYFQPNVYYSDFSNYMYKHCIVQQNKEVHKGLVYEI